MSQAALTVNAGYIVDNSQKFVIIRGSMVLSGTVYEAGGVPLDAVLLALPEATTNSGVAWCIMTDDTGSGYIFQRIASTGAMMILQVPPNGSLTTAAPLQQLPSSTNLSNIGNRIHFEAGFKRNA
jgi:lipoprotein signal peptidase